jgi:hypothetical protein
MPTQVGAQCLDGRKYITHYAQKTGCILPEGTQCEKDQFVRGRIYLPEV